MDIRHRFIDFFQGLPVASHLEFQMCLYFNCWYMPFWVAVTVYALYDKFSSLDTMLAILCPIFVAFSFLLEASRLYFGYYGNLFENGPTLGAFFLITLFLQMPLLVVQLASFRFRLIKAEWWMDLVLLGFLFCETITGWLAYRQISSVNAKKLLGYSETSQTKRL